MPCRGLSLLTLFRLFELSRAAVLALLLASLGSVSAAQVSPATLRGGGAYDTVWIAGFLVPIDDVETLDRAGVLGLNPQTNRFSFGGQIGSERDLTSALATLSLQDARAVRDMYRVAKVSLPNGVSHTLTVPSGYGPASLSNQRDTVALGVGIGGVSRVFGLSFGNSFETVGATIGLSLNDLSDLTNRDRVSLGFELSRYISDGFSVSVGGENLFVRETDGEASYYVAGSWAFDAGTGAMPFDGVATLGLGSGRFANKTPRDVVEGRGANGTIVFGAMAWEITDTVNLIADWNGRNLTVRGAFRIPETDISVKVGLRDLTGNSGDGVRLTGSVGYTLARF